MSTPDYLTIRRVPEKDTQPWHPYFETVWLDSWAGEALFEYMLPHMPQVASEEADAFEGGYYGGVLSISSISPKNFYPVYNLIMQACDELESLKPYKAELKAALEADPRFKQAA